MVRSSTGAGGGPYWNSNPCGVTIAQVKPDWHLMAFAYASLAIAAAGDTSIPFLYGQLIDAIAISRDVGKFQQYMLLLVGTALVTGVFTGFRGSTFIILYYINII